MFHSSWSWIHICQHICLFTCPINVYACNCVEQHVWDTGGHLNISFLYVSLEGKKCQILQSPQHRMVHISRKNAKPEKNSTFSTSVGQLTKQCLYTCSFFSATFQDCKLDHYFKHAAAQFTPFLAPFFVGANHFVLSKKEQKPSWKFLLSVTDYAWY